MKYFPFRWMFVISMFYFALAACNRKPNDALIGLWKASDVQTEFDESKVNPATLQQVAEIEKQTMLRFENDSALTIMMGEKNFAAHYTYDVASGKIFYGFEGKAINMNELGVLSEKTITTTSKTPVGTIRVVYTKSR